VFIQGIRALGIDNGAAKGDIKLTSRGPMIGEIAARLSGGYMSGWTYPYASGVNPVHGAICAALGREPEGLAPVRDWTSAERAFISIPGIVSSIEGIEKAKNTPYIKDLFFRAEPSRRVSFPENNVSKAGNVISAAPDRETAVQAAENAARAILIRLDCPNAETGAFLAGPLTARVFPPPAFTLDAALLEMLDTIPQTVPGTNSRNFFHAFMESGLTDYMGRSLRETFEAIRQLTGLSLQPDANLGGMDAAETDGLDRSFWVALIRGGYQGAVYYIDCLTNGACCPKKEENSP
jgi:hypothetical protein